MIAISIGHVHRLKRLSAKDKLQHANLLTTIQMNNSYAGLISRAYRDI